MAASAVISSSAIINLNTSAITGVWLSAHLLTACCHKHVKYWKNPLENRTWRQVWSFALILAISVWHFRMQWRIPLIIREAHSLPRSRAAFSSINWVCSAPLPEIVPYWSQIYSICLTSHSFKFRCHPIVINLTEVEGSANGIHIFFFLSSRSNRELKIFMGEVIPSSKPPSASPPVFSHPSLCGCKKPTLGIPDPNNVIS